MHAHVLVALAVAELETAGQVGVAALRATPAAGVVAARLAEGEAAAAPRVAATGGIAVDVVAGPAAVRGVVRHPPPAHDGVLGAVVEPADGAAELGEPRAARAAAATAGAPALADRAVGGAGPEREIHAGADRHGAAHEGRPVDEAAPGEAPVEKPGGAGCDRRRQAHDEALLDGGDRTSRRTPSSAARAESATTLNQRPAALTNSSGIPAQG